MEIKHPDWLQIEQDNRILYGYNQGWYRTFFRRASGCGPTTAAMLLLYLNMRESGSLPYQNDSIPSITKALEDIWKFVTPGWLGLSSTGKFCKGVEAFLQHHGLSWKCHALSLFAARSKRKSLLEVVQFLEEGITSDCPIAFLNLHKGKVTALEGWHWTALVSLSYDENQKRYMATCYDGGRRITFDLDVWLTTTKLGGGFVYLTT